jgi:hypothetical protein
VKFEIDPFRKHCLINGLDDIGLTMEKKSSIDTYEAKRSKSAPGPDRVIDRVTGAPINRGSFVWKSSVREARDAA